MITKRQFDKFVWKYGTATAILIGCLFIAVSIYLSFGLPARQTRDKPQPSSVAQAILAQQRVEVSADDDPVLGRVNAPITLIEFSDFQCPFCRKFWRDTLPGLKKTYFDTGKVRFVYRDFPLPIHPAAKAAAEAAECAGDQGQFWEMHDKIFLSQDQQGAGTIQFEAADMKRWAREIGLNESEFNRCLDEGKYSAEVMNDLSDGQVAGVSGTPTIFINGLRIVGAQPWAVFAEVIESELRNQ